MEGFVKSVQSFATTIYNTGRVKSEPLITSKIFRLHYPFNFVILCVLTVLATYQISGKAIQCTVDAAIVDQSLMNTYCWIQSTYTLPGRLGEISGRSVVAPGVGSIRHNAEPVQYHKYYQWVVFFLVFQAILFYIPYYLWRTFENGRIGMLLVPGEKTTIEDVDLSATVNFFYQSKIRKLSNNNTYFRVYIFFEVLNLINVIGQIFFIDRFLGYEFTTYGTRVLEFIEQDSNIRFDPMDAIFPKVSKCTFRVFGPSGNIINYDGLCVLALNIFYEKIFIFLWFWLIILGVITLIGVIWRFITLFSHKIRTILLRQKVLNFTRHPELMDDPRFDPIIRLPTLDNPKFEAIQVIMDKFSSGDWFLLYQLSLNMWPHHYSQLIKKLASKFGWTEPKQE